jgi:hypothetical protein
LADFLIGDQSAYTLGVTSANGGKDYVVYGKKDTTAIDLASLNTGTSTNGFLINGIIGAQGTMIGQSISNLGDVNGDGIPDLIVAGYDSPLSSTYVVFGKTGNQTVNISNVSAGLGGYSITGGTNSPSMVSNAGDVNGDGLADMLIGNYNNNVSYVVYGKASTASGNAAVNLLNLSSGTSTEGFAILGATNGGGLGNGVSSLGDVNGDGLADVIINSPTGNNSYVLFGKAGGGANVYQSAIDAGMSTSGFALIGSSSAPSRYTVSSAGDFNGDGLADMIVIGYASTVSGMANAGKVYVVFGQTGTTPIYLSNVDKGMGGFVINGQSANDYLGSAVSYAGDLNGDGYGDLLVNAYNASPLINTGGTALTGAGKTYVIYGGPQFISGNVALATGTSADDYVVGTSGNDTLIGNGGIDRFNAGKGNDTIVLQASDVSNLASNVVGNTKAMVDGGTGFDTLQVSAAGVNLDLTAISNVGGMTSEGQSRINSIERINLGADTSANTLTLTAKDVNDMADFNSIHLTTVSDDGKIWTNVIGTALSATTQFHQVVVEGTSADKLNLSLGFSSAGTVSNGSTTYNVYQNTATNSQVIADSAITNVVIPPDPLNATACAAVFTSSSTGWNGLTGQVAVAINSPAFANATIKLYVNSTLVQTATMSASGSYNGQSLGLSPSRLTVNNNDIVHGEFVVNGVTYVIGGGMKYLNPTSAGNGSGTQVAVTYATPLVLDLNGDGVQTVGLNESVQFDLTDSGTPQKTSWVDKQDGLLAIDLNGDGQINSGAELFGNHTQLANGTTASNGWAALGAMDSNHDGKIEAHDANFDKLRVWVDANGDGVTDAGELHTLAEVNVASINLNADNTITYQNGNALQGFSSFTSTDGTTHDIVDVSFLVQPVLADVGLQVQNAMSNVFTLSMGESLDLSGLGNATQESGINMSTDSAANSVKLTLTDVLNTAVTNGLHQLTLTGDANDSVQLTAHEWTNTGTTVAEGEHTYAVYNATTSSEAQLLIDQAMVNAGHVM